MKEEERKKGRHSIRQTARRGRSSADLALCLTRRDTAVIVVQVSENKLSAKIKQQQKKTSWKSFIPQQETHEIHNSRCFLRGGTLKRNVYRGKDFQGNNGRRYHLHVASQTLLTLKQFKLLEAAGKVHHTTRTQRQRAACVR